MSLDKVLLWTWLKKVSDGSETIEAQHSFEAFLSTSFMSMQSRRSSFQTTIDLWFIIVTAVNRLVHIASEQGIDIRNLS